MRCSYSAAPQMMGLLALVAVLACDFILVKGAVASNVRRLDQDTDGALAVETCVVRSSVLSIELPGTAQPLPDKDKLCGTAAEARQNVWLTVHVASSTEVVRNVSVCDRTQVVITSDLTMLLSLAQPLESGVHYNLLLGYPEGVSPSGQHAFAFETCSEDLRRPEVLQVSPTGILSQLRLAGDALRILFSKAVFAVAGKHATIRAVSSGAVLFDIDVANSDCGASGSVEDGCVVIEEMSHSILILPRGLTEAGEAAEWAAPGTRYEVQIEAGAFVDDARSGALANTNLEISWRFEVSADTVGPVAESGSLSGNVTGLRSASNNGHVRLTFDESVSAATSSIAIAAHPHAGERPPAVLETVLAESGSYQTVTLRFDCVVQVLENSSVSTWNITSLDAGGISTQPRQVTYAGNFVILDLPAGTITDSGATVTPATDAAVVTTQGLPWQASVEVFPGTAASEVAPAVLWTSLSGYACISQQGVLSALKVHVNKALATISQWALIMLQRCPLDAPSCSQDTAEVMWALTAASETTSSTVRVTLDPSRPMEATFHFEELLETMLGSAQQPLQPYTNYQLVLQPGLLRDFNTPALSNLIVAIPLPVCDVEYDELAGNVLHIYSPAPFASQDSSLLSQSFEVQVAEGAVEDRWGNPSPWSTHVFYEEAVLPVLMPQDCNPAAGAQAVISENIVLAFSEPVQAGSGLLELWVVGGTSPAYEVDVSTFEQVAVEQGVRAISGRFVSITPRIRCREFPLCADLEVGATYFLKISTAGVLVDLNGNPLPELSTELTWSFIVMEDNGRPPQILYTGELVANLGQATSPPTLTGRVYFSERIALRNTTAQVLVKACRTDLGCTAQDDTKTFSTRDFAFGDGSATAEGTTDAGLFTFRVSSWVLSSWLNRRYAVTVPAGLVQSSSTGSSGPVQDVTLYFDVGEVTTDLSDSTPPRILKRLPENGEEFAAANTSITFTFDEDIAAGSGNLRLCVNSNAAEDTGVGAQCEEGLLASGAPTVMAVSDAVIDRRRITFQWSEPFQSNQTLYVIVPAGIVKDMNGNPWGRLENTMYFFSVRTAEQDSTPPEIATCNGGACIEPTPGLEDWPTSPTITLEFTEPIRAGSGSLTLEAEDDAVPTEVRWGVDIDPTAIEGKRAYVSLRNLRPGMSYVARTNGDDGGFVTDEAGLPLPASEFAFKVASRDATSPSLLTTWPPLGDTVAPSTYIALIFSEAVHLSDVGAAGISIRVASRQVPSAAVLDALESLGSIIRLRLEGLDIVASEDMSVSISSGAIFDAGGNDFAGVSDLKWATASNTASLRQRSTSVGSVTLLGKGSAFMYVHGGLLAHGGRTAAGCSNASFALNPVSNDWQLVDSTSTSRPKPAVENPAFATDMYGCVFVLGGECSEGDASKIWHSCDSLRTWTPLSPTLLQGQHLAGWPSKFAGGASRSHAMAVLGGWQLVIIDTSAGAAWVCLQSACDTIVRTAQQLPFGVMESPSLVAAADNTLFLLGGVLGQVWKSPFSSLHVGRWWEVVAVSGAPQDAVLASVPSASVVAADNRLYLAVWPSNSSSTTQVYLASLTAPLLQLHALSLESLNASDTGVLGIAAGNASIEIAAGKRDQAGVSMTDSTQVWSLRTPVSSYCAAFVNDLDDVSCSESTCTGSPPSLGHWATRTRIWRAPSLDGALCTSGTRGGAAVGGDEVQDVNIPCPCPLCGSPDIDEPPAEFRGFIGLEANTTLEALGPVVKMSCSAGFRASGAFQCLPQGPFSSVWQEPFPTCLERECASPPPFVLPEDDCALITPSNPLRVNGTCPLLCAAGLQVPAGDADASFTCRYGAFQSSGCERQSCNNVPIVAHGGIVCPTDPVRFGDECFLTCDAGFYLAGNASVRCDVATSEPGSAPAFTEVAECLPLACSPPSFEDAFAVVRSYSEGELVVGSTAEVGCADGYTIPPPGSSTVTFECRGGQGAAAGDEAAVLWEPAQAFECVPQACSGLPEALVEARWACGLEGVGGALCSLKCPVGFRPSNLSQVECVNGLFIGDAPEDSSATCSRVECPAVPTLAHVVNTSCPPQVLHEGTCSVTCSEGYEVRGRYSCFDGYYETMPVCVPPGWSSSTHRLIWTSLYFEIAVANDTGDGDLNSNGTFIEECEEAIIDALAPWHLSEVTAQVRGDTSGRRLTVESIPAVTYSVRLDFKVGSFSNHTAVLNQLQTQQALFRERFVWSLEARYVNSVVTVTSMSEPRVVEEDVAQQPVDSNYTAPPVRTSSSTGFSSDSTLLIFVAIIMGACLAVVVVFSMRKTMERKRRRRRQSRDQEFLPPPEDPMYPAFGAVLPEAYTARNPLPMQRDLLAHEDEIPNERLPSPGSNLPWADPPASMPPEPPDLSALPPPEQGPPPAAPDIHAGPPPSVPDIYAGPPPAAPDILIFDT